MKNSIFLIFTALLFCILANARQVGDPGVTFDASKYDSDYPEMKEWEKAGVEGGIPWYSSTPLKKTISATNSDGLNAAIVEVSNSGGGQLKLNNGTYTINKLVTVKSNVRIVGASRTGVKLNITMTGSGGHAIEFSGQKAGIENLTIQGGYGTPNNHEMIDAKSNFIITSVYFPRAAQNCWLDRVNIYNSGNSAISSWDCKHITIRNCDIQRSWNKGGGGHGYVSLQGNYMLMTGTHVKYMRHISIQNQYAKYNVLYDNDFEQEVSFHVGDAGYNLVENNSIILPSGIGSGWHAIMTPWSVQHDGPGPRNAVYKNSCKENNNGGIVSYSNPNIVYVPKAHYQVFTESYNTPKGGTFYPVNNVEGSTSGTTTVQMKKRNASSYAIDGGVGGANGQNVYIWSFGSSNVNQQWEEIDRGSGYYSYKKINTNYCLDGGNGGTNGQNVYLWSCSSTNQNQHWKKVNVGSGNYRLEKRNASGYSIDGGNGGANRQNLYLWSSNNSNQNQHWTFSTVNKSALELPEMANSIAEVAVYPNPFSQDLAIESNFDVEAIKIINLKGIVVYEEKFSSLKSIKLQPALDNMPVGLYVLVITMEHSTETYLINRIY